MNTNLTIVTGLLNMNRDSCDEQFRRPYSFYLERFKTLMESCLEYPMVIFCSRSDEDFIWNIRDRKNTQLVYKELRDFISWFEFFDQVQEIRSQPKWKNQADWLSKSPQATLEFYNPFVMSKPFMLSDASIMDPFKTDYFIWLDAALPNTVHSGYFSNDKILDKINPYLDPFLFLSYPYATGAEIHGFEREAMNHYARTENVEYVCRGGLFGGRKENIRNMTGIYYQLLSKTLDEGFMGTEESIFTIMSYLYPNEMNRFMLKEHGMISNFMEAVKTGQGYFEVPKKKPGVVPSLLDSVILNPIEIHPKDLNTTMTTTTIRKSRTFSSLNSKDTGLYVLTFNFPEQLKMTLNSIRRNQPEFLSETKKFLVDNSTDTTAMLGNKQLALEYGFEVINKSNIGICGGRQFIAEHFSEQPDLNAYLFFEDDMTFCDSDTPCCKAGFSRWVKDLFRKSRKILDKEELDFLKLTFTEFYGDNGRAWSWFNLPKEVRPNLFPEAPEKLDNIEPPRTRFSEINSLEGLSYAKGLVHFCNWPLLMTQEGSRKIFLDPPFNFPHEATLMSHSYQRQVKGEISGAVLLLSPIDHIRLYHYPAASRVECL